MRSHGGAVPSPHPAMGAASSPSAACPRRPAPFLRPWGRPPPGPSWARPAAGSGVGSSLPALLRPGRLGASGSVPRVLSGQRRRQLTAILLLDPSGRGGRERGVAGRAPRSPPAPRPQRAERGVSGGRRLPVRPRCTVLSLAAVVPSGSEDTGELREGRTHGPVL